ncbi:zinc finger and SCAN domain-containing protein 5B-like [Peromyscus leucopus]|uniref:zinc finger and SCAN domain-containing protein 5B-like n=1 Tax=Peromyscus leucopus TaxID=10041 RepID=UPI0018849A0F|nr:zinc finger and SCAN domain-containing protein 5B-like [Peromyscus leucopus]
MAINTTRDSLPSEQTPSPTSQDWNSEKEDYSPEVWHLKFRAFSPSEQSDPIQDLKRISELCYQWLRPDLNSKEEILDQLVLEQFMISMPPELQALVKESGVKSCQELEKMLRDDSVRGEDVKMPQEDTNTDAVTPFTHVLERRDLAAHTDLQSLSSSNGDKVPTCQGGASCVDRTEDGQLGLATLRPVEPVDHLAGQAKFVCSECKKSFLYRSQFIIHQRSHTGERPFECSVCKKGFVQSSDLRVHKRIHRGEKPYVCRICSKRFAHKSTLLGRLRIHTKEKPYECEHCGTCFYHKGNLSVHLGTHSDSRPHRCKECDKAFRQQGTLKRHMKIHSRMELSFDVALAGSQQAPANVLSLCIPDNAGGYSKKQPGSGGHSEWTLRMRPLSCDAGAPSKARTGGVEKSRTSLGRWKARVYVGVSEGGKETKIVVGKPLKQ